MKVKNKNKANPEISSASMSDIAFLLIIFFMLTTVFSQEQGLNYRIPETLKKVPTEKRNLEVTVLADGKLKYDDRLIELSSLRDIAIARKAQNEEIFAVLRVEEQTPYSFIISTMDEILIGGINNIAFVPAEGELEDVLNTPGGP